MELLTVQEAADRLKVSKRTVERAITAGNLRASQIATRGTWRIDIADLERWVQSRTQGPVAAPPPKGKPKGTLSAPPRGSQLLPAPPMSRRRRRAGSGRLSVTPDMGRES
jgi:excisionase family DNA binding protein